MEDLGDIVGTSILSRLRISQPTNLACYHDTEKQLQRQGLGQYGKLRCRDNITSIIDDIMYRSDILLHAMGIRHIVMSALLPFLYVFRRFRRIYEKMDL